MDVPLNIIEELIGRVLRIARQITYSVSRVDMIRDIIEVSSCTSRVLGVMDSMMACP